MLNNELNRLKQYEQLAIKQQTNISELKGKVDRLSFLRVALLLVEIGFFVGLVSSKGDVANAIWSVLLLLPIAVFIAVVKRQNVLEKQFKFHQNLLWVFETKLLCCKANLTDTMMELRLKMKAILIFPI